MSLVVRGGQLILPDRLVAGDLAIADGKICSLGKLGNARVTSRVVDARDLYVAPGFIDLHVNGGGGGGFAECTSSAFTRAIGFHVQHGTTGLLPTAVAGPLQQMRDFLRFVGIFMQQTPVVLGAHLNGPFVSVEKGGALDPKFILKPSVELFRSLVKDARHVVKVVTLAPEEEGSAHLVLEILRIGAIPALGHTNATYLEAVRAINSGVALVTHVFNAMRGLHHREPGAVGAALDADSTVLELIADGIHVHPAVVRLLVKVKAPKGIVLVTDATSAAGMGDGEFLLGTVPIVVKGGAPTSLASGASAGSILTMERAVQNLVEYTGLDLPTAVSMASLNPARALGIHKETGSIETGKAADLVIFDSTFVVHYTIVRGNILYDINRRSADHA